MQCCSSHFIDVILIERPLMEYQFIILSKRDELFYVINIYGKDKLFKPQVQNGFIFFKF